MSDSNSVPGFPEGMPQMPDLEGLKIVRDPPVNIDGEEVPPENVVPTQDELDELYVRWNEQSRNIKWGVAKIFKDILTANQEGKTTLIYGSQYGPAGPYLLNDRGVMLAVADDAGSTPAGFASLVRLFDLINSTLYMASINTKGGIVSRNASDILLTHFGDIDTPPVGVQVSEATAEHAFESLQTSNATEADIARDLASMFVVAEVPTVLKFNYNHIALFEMQKLPQREASFEE